MKRLLWWVGLLYLLGVAQASTTLRFNETGFFRIQQQTDLHYEGVIDGERTKGIQKKLIEYESPDLVVLTGDVHSGWKFNHLPLLYKEGWKTMASELESHKIPWAFVHGNHDAESGLSRAEIVNYVVKTFPHTLTELGPAWVQGAGNYYLPIFSSTNASRVAAVLWFFDSGSYDCGNITHTYACIDRTQIEWYMATSKGLALEYNDGNLIPGLAFFHIPQPQWFDVWNNQECEGLRGEDVACPRVDGGLLDAFASMGDVQAVFVGHDHDNDYCGTYKGIRLCYGRKTGVGCYGPPTGVERGARMIQLVESRLASAGRSTFGFFDTWIRNEKGAIETQPLHAPEGPGQTECATISK